MKDENHTLELLSHLSTTDKSNLLSEGSSAGFRREQNEVTKTRHLKKKKLHSHTVPTLLTLLFQTACLLNFYNHLGRHRSSFSALWLVCGKGRMMYFRPQLHPLLLMDVSKAISVTGSESEEDASSLYMTPLVFLFSSSCALPEENILDCMI